MRLGKTFSAQCGTQCGTSLVATASGLGFLLKFKVNSGNIQGVEQFVAADGLCSLCLCSACFVVWWLKAVCLCVCLQPVVVIVILMNNYGGTTASFKLV